MKRKQNDFNIQSFIENAVTTLTNNIKKINNSNEGSENFSKQPTGQAEDTSSISQRLAAWSENLQKTVNYNIERSNQITEEIKSITQPKYPNSTHVNHREDNDDIPPFIKNRIEEIKKEQQDIENKGNTNYNPNSTEEIDAIGTSQIEEIDVTHQSVQTEQEVNGKLAKPKARLLSKQKVRVLEDALKTRVFGQDEVISEVVTTLKSAALNIKINKEKPAGCYLFAGPSGVGKTELATSLADKLDVPILKINMGEYSLETDITKLIGTSKGYVGYKEGGLLTNFVKENPACVVLFDELEKAHSSIDKPLLSIMDHGICTDNTGQDVSFKETIIIATSNLGAEVEYYGDLSKEEKDHYRMEAIKDGLRPEIINRYDSIFHFNALTPEIYALVSQKFLTKLQENMQEEHNFTLKFSNKLIDFIVEKSYDPAMGGRPARRFIEQIVIEPLVDRMLEEDFDLIIEEHSEIIMDLNKAGNICFKGKKNKILGVQNNTAELVARIEESKFTKKNTAEKSSNPKP